MSFRKSIALFAAAIIFAGTIAAGADGMQLGAQAATAGISREEAKDIALDDAGLTENEPTTRTA